MQNVVESEVLNPLLCSLWGHNDKFHGNPSNSWQETHLLEHIIWEPFIICTNVVPIHQVDVEMFHRINEKFDLAMVLEEKSENQPKSCEYILKGSWKSVPGNLIAIHPIAVEMFLSEAVVDRPSDTTAHLASYCVRLP